jgi:glycerol-3-phosphate dehydrogenase
VFGGKITTFRKLAEEAVDLIAARLGNTHGTWTEHACLPGGDIYGAPQNRAVLGFDEFVSALQQSYAWLPPKLLARYARAYGTRTHLLLAHKTNLAEMGEAVAEGLYAAELEYLVKNEWASCSADILWRRSKLGLHLPADTAQRIDHWLATKKEESRQLTAA